MNSISFCHNIFNSFKKSIHFFIVNCFQCRPLQIRNLFESANVLNAIVGQSVLLQDEAKHNSGGDVAINMDGTDKSRYQQQLQLIDEQVCITLKLNTCLQGEKLCSLTSPKVKICSDWEAAQSYLNLYKVLKIC